METKFKKGDPVRAVKSDSFGSFQKGDEGKVVYVGCKNVTIDFKRGPIISMTLRGVEDVFELIEPTESPRLASEMTLREHYAGLALQGLLSDPNVSDLHQAAISAVSAADYLIQALIEKP